MPKLRTGHKVAWVLRGILALAILWSLFQGHWSDAGLLFLSLGASGLVHYICRHYLGEIGQWEDVLFALLIIFNNLFGIVLDFYHTVPGWDIATHYTTSIFLAVSALLLMQKAYPVVLQESPKILIVLGLILFSLGLGGAWEIMEFFVDLLFHTNTQISLANTMQDLIVDAIAGLAVALIWWET